MLSNYELRLAQIKAARRLFKAGAHRMAAAYLRITGWSIEAAVFLLLNKSSRDYRRESRITD